MFGTRIEGIKVFRSVERVAVAFEEKLFGKELGDTRKDLEAALYAAKFAGCAVSENEIKEFLRSVKK